MCKKALISKHAFFLYLRQFRKSCYKFLKVLVWFFPMFFQEHGKNPNQHFEKLVARFSKCWFGFLPCFFKNFPPSFPRFMMHDARFMKVFTSILYPASFDYAHAEG